MVTPIAIIGPRVDLALNDPIELPGDCGLLRSSVGVEANDAENERPPDPGPHTRTTTAKRRAWRADRPAAFV
jgi:hypothetical protein